MSKKIFAIFSAKKSGSSLLRQLVDGHPELYVYPTEFRSRYFWDKSNFENLEDFKIKYLFNTNDSLKGNSRHIKRFRFNLKVNDFYNEFLKRNTECHFTGLNMNIYHQSIVDELKRLNKTDGLLEIEFRSLQKGLNKSYNENLHHCYKEVGDTALHLLKLVSNKLVDKVVIIERDPRAILSSRIRFDKQTHNMTTSFLRKFKLIFSLYRLQNDYMKIRNSRHKNSFLFIDYDELVSNPMGTMSGISEFLDIINCDELLIPSVFGIPRRVSTASKTSMNGIVTHSVNLWKRELNFIDLFLCSILINDKKNSFNIFSLLLRKMFKWTLSLDRQEVGH